MIIFELSMPGTTTWNGSWTGEGKIYAKAIANNKVPEDVIGKEFGYNFGDGWFASIKVIKMDNSEAKKIMKASKGFMNYDWMIDSIIKNKKIVIESKDKK